jgi:4-amino-4-deoxy-L-arabinose transferase-like glycosyltransferase
MTKRFSMLEFICLGIIAVCVVLFSYPFFFYALGSFRELVTFNMDSASILRDIQDALEAPRFRLNFTTYGQLFYNLCIALAYLYSCVAHLGEYELFFIIRLVTWLGGIFSIAVIYVFVRRFVGRVEAIYAAAALAAFPIVLLMFVDPHPDTWQMFFVILTLYYCARAVEAIQDGVEPQSGRFKIRADVAFVLKASAAAGAAFSTKYIGVFFLPLLALLAVALPPITIGSRHFKVYLRWLAFAMALFAVPLIVLGFESRPSLFLGVLPEWRALPESVLKSIAIVVRWSAFAVGIFSLVTAAAVARGHRFLAYETWFMRAALLTSIGFTFAIAFALTSPWAAYHLRFFPELYNMSAYVKFGHGMEAPWGGPYWFKLMMDGAGFIAVILFLIGAAALIGSLVRRKDRHTMLPLLVVLGWVALFGGYLLTRVNLIHDQYMIPLIPGIIVLAALGLKFVQTRIASGATERLAFAAAALIAFVAVSLQVVQNRSVYAAARRDLVTSLTPDNQLIGRWYSRCVPNDARIFPAPYTYIPPDIPAVWFRTQGYNALENFKPNLIMVQMSDAKLFIETPELTSATVLGTASDTSRFYKIVLQSGDYVAGPQFGDNRAYLTPDLARALAERGPECLHP